MRRGFEEVHNGIVRIIGMVEQNVLAANGIKERIGVAADADLARGEWGIF